MTLKDFQKFVKKGPPGKKSKNVLTPAGSWLANATKSMGYGMMDVTSQLVPNSVEHLRSAKENVDVIKDAVTSAKGGASKQIRDAIDHNDYIKMAKEGVRNALDDLKTGKFYNQERRQKFISDQMGGDFDMDFDDDFGADWETEGEFSADDDGASVRVTSAGKDGVHVSNISMSNNIGEGSPLVEATNYQTATIAKGTEALANTSIANTQIVANILGRIGEEQGRSFAALSSTVADVSSEINTKITELTGLSATYFNDSMSIFKEINESLNAIKASSSAGTATMAAKAPRELKDALAVIGAGGTLNMSAYRDMVKRNAKSWAESDFIASTLFSVFSQKETLQDMMQQPLKFVIDSAVNTLIPQTMKAAAKNLDAMVGEFFTTGLTQLGSARNSSNPIVAALGQIFGIRQDMRTSINRGNYEKGKVNFDGITHRTINEVIPTYLRQMVSLLSGREEMGYDYEKGMFRSVRSMEKDYENTIRRNKLNPFSDDIDQFSTMLDTQFTAKTKNEKDALKKEFENAIIKIVNNGGLENYRKVYRKNGTVRDPLAELTGLRDEHLEILRGFFEGRSRTDGGNAANARTFGTAIQEARGAVSRTNMQMEQNPFLTNAQYARNGMEGHTNAHLRFPKEGERGSRIRQIGGVNAGLFDKYGHSVVDYARDITKLLMKGIVVFPYIAPAAPISTSSDGGPAGPSGGGKKGKKYKGAAGPALSSSTKLLNPYGTDLENFKKEANKLSLAERIETRENRKYQKELEEGRIDISNMDGLTLEQVALASAQSIDEEREREIQKKPSLLQRLRGGNGTLAKWAGMLDDKVQKGSGAVTKGIRAVDDFLYGLLFGDGKTKGMRYLFDKVWDGMKAGFHKFGKFMDDRVLKPIDNMLFGEDGIFTKFKESQFYQDISSKFKNATDFLGERIFGKKVEGPNGVTYEGGLISNTINAFGDIGRATKDAILGAKGPDGKPLPLDQDTSIVGGIKRTFNDASKMVADKLGIKSKDNENGMTFKELMGTAIHSTMDRFKSRVSGFMDNIFGKASDSDFVQNGRDVLNNFKTEMEGKGGYVAAGSILGAVGVPILSSSMGLLGSIFLPGGPIGGAILGAGISFVTQSETLKTKLFGETDENGERMGGIISRDIQKLFKDNKTGIALGAGLGLISSWGLLPGMFLPGGPLGGAILGAGISMVAKSKAFSDLLYGPDGTKDDPTGGLIERFKSIFGKQKDFKGLAMDAAIGGGVGLIGSFFLPGGPIFGSLVGAGISIVTNTERFKKIMFGNEEFDEEGNSLGRHGGLIGKFTSFIEKKAVFPFMRKFEEMQVNLNYFIKDKIVRPISIAIAPITHKLIDIGEGLGDIVKTTFDRIGEKFEQIVLQPVGDAVDKYIITPVKSLASKLWKGFTTLLGTIIAAPFALIGEVGKGIYKGDMKRGERAAVDKAKQDRNAKTLELLRGGHILGALGTFTKGTFNAHRPKTKIEGRHSKDGAGWYASATNNPILNDKRIHQENLSERERRLAEIDAKYANKGSANRQNIRKAKKNVSERIATQAEDTAKIQEQTLSETSQVVENTSKISTATEAIKDWVSSIANRFGIGKKKEKEEETSETKKRFRGIRGAKISGAKITKGGRIQKTDEETPEESSAPISERITTSEGGESGGKEKKRNLSGRSILDYVKLIYKEVDGNLNGVGYNVNKLYSLMLNHFGKKDDDIKGGGNKKYRGLLGRFAHAIGAPFRFVQDIALAPFRVLKSVGSGILSTIGSIGSSITHVVGATINGVVGGVGDILAALASIPGNLLKVAGAAITGVVKVVGTGIEVAADTLVTAIKVGGETLLVGIRAVGGVVQGAALGLGKAIGNTIAGLSVMGEGILKLGGSLFEGAGKLGKGLLSGLGEVGKGVGKGIGAAASGLGSLLGRGIGGIGGLFGNARPVYVIGGKLDEVSVVHKVRKVNQVRKQKEKEEGGNGGFGGRFPMGGFGLFTASIPKVYIEGGYLDGIRESEKKEERFNEPDQSAMQAVAEKLDETVLAGTGAQIRSDQATATDNGSAKSIREVWKKEEAEEQAANAAKEEQKQTSLLARIAGSSEEHKNLFGGIFGPKGKIAMLLMLAIPAVIAFFKNDGLRNLLFEGMEWLFKKITDNLPAIATTLAGAIAGAIPTIVQNIPKIFNFAANGLETVVNAFRRRNGGGKNGTGYQVDENGTIIRDENGVPISNDAREGRGFFETIRDTIFPTVTRIDPKTGRAENLRTSDGFSEILTHHGARIGTKMGIRAYRLAKPVVKAGVAGVKGAVHGVKAAGSYLASAGKYSKALGFMHRMGAEKGLAQQGAATLAGGNKGKLLGTAMNYADEAVSATANRIKNSSLATKAVGYVDDVGKRLASTKAGSAVTKVASKGGGIIKQFIKIAKEGIEFLTTKLTEFMTKHGAKKGAETGVLATIKKLTSTLSETTLGKFAGKITSAVGSFVAGLSPATVANIAFAGLAFINANPAQVFNVDKSAVDWKMQLIARTMKALLGTSFGMIFDVLFEIANSLFGFDIGKEICVGLYNAISGEKDEADLKKAQEEFDAEWRQYQDTEYEAYCQHELEVGNTPMTREEFEAAGLSTSKMEYNRNRNKTIGGKIMGGITGAWNGAKKLASGAKNAIGNAVEGAKGGLQNVISGAKDLYSKTSAKAKDLRHKLLGDDLANKVELAGEKSTELLMGLGKKAGGFLKGAYDKASSGISKARHAVLGDELAGKIESANKAQMDSLLSVGKSIKDFFMGTGKKSESASTEGKAAPLVTDGLGAIKSQKALPNIRSKVQKLVEERHDQAMAGKDVTAATTQLTGSEEDATLNSIDAIMQAQYLPLSGTNMAVNSATDKINSLLANGFGTIQTSANDALKFKNGVIDKNYFKISTGKKSDDPSVILSDYTYNMVRYMMLPMQATNLSMASVNNSLGTMGSMQLSTSSSATSRIGGMGGYGGDNTYVSQNDPALANQPYRLSNGAYDTFRNRGCGPAAMTMVANKLGRNADPLDVANDATKGGYSTEVGTRTEFFGNEASRMGLSSSKMAATENNLNASLGGYGPVIIQGADDNPNSPFTPQGHYVVGNRVSGDYIDIDDPRGPQYSGLYKTSEVAKGARNMWSFGSGKASGGFGTGRVNHRSKLGGFGLATNIMINGAQNAIGGGGVCPRMVVETAAKEIGYLEKASNAQLDDKTANAGRANYTKYNRDMKLAGVADFWCASFVCWVFMQACGGDRARATKMLGQLSASCNDIMNALKSQGRFDKNPIVGDCVFFPGKRHSGANHIGIVVGVEGGNVYTIEGNTSGGAGVQDNGGGVFFKTHPISACLGFGHPNYESWENNYAGIKDASGLAASGGSSPFAGGSTGGSTSNSILGSVASGLTGFLSDAARAMFTPLFTLLGWNTGETSAMETSGGTSSFTSMDGSNIIASVNGDELGAYVKEFESGSKGPACVANNSGDYGGMSFGSYQLASFKKNPASQDSHLYQFWDRYGYTQKYPGVAPGQSEAFKNTWLKAAQEDPNFAKNEHEFYVTDFYTPGVKNIAKYIGGDVNTLSRAAQEAAWSTIVQHGPADDTSKGTGAPQIFKSAGVKVNMGNEEFIQKLYDYKINSVPTRFKSSSAAVQQGVRNRFLREKAKLLPLANTPPLGKSTTGGATTGTQGAFNLAQNAVNALESADNLASKGGSATGIQGMGGVGGRPVLSRTEMQSAPRCTPVTPTLKLQYKGGYGGTTDSQIAEKLDRIDATLQAIATSSSGTNSGVAKLYDKDFGSPTTNNNNFNSFNVGGKGEPTKPQTSFKDVTGRDRSGYAAAKQLAAGGLLGT